MPALGDEFRSAREARGLSLPDVAERLHIRTVYLTAIEEEDWKAIGAPVYIRGFMRTYARFLGLDAEDAVARFTTSAAAQAPAATARAVEDRPRERAPAGERSGLSIVAILSLVVAAVIVAYVAYAYVQFHAGPPVPVAVASPDADADTPAADGSPAAEAVALPSPAHLARPNRTLHIALTQTSWLRVTIDGKVETEGTFPAGTAKSYVGNVAELRVGNAGGVKVAVNGRALAPLGGSGDVAERRLTLSGE